MPEIEIIEVIIPGPQGAKGATGDVTPEAIAARDEAVAVAASSGKWLPSQSVIESDETLPTATAEGTVVRTLDGYGYDVLAPAAPSYARLTSAGVKLGVRSDKGEWYAKAFGISDVGTDQRSKVEKMIGSGETAFVFEPTNDRIVIDGNVSLRSLISVRGGRFDQKTLACQTFDIPVGENGVHIRDMDFVGSYNRNFTNVSYRGDNSFGQSCAIWSGASDTIIENISVSDMVTAVWFSPWDGSANVFGQKGNAVRGLRIKNCDFGILYKGQDGVEMSHLYGENITLSPGSPNPGHIIYGTGDHTFRSRNVNIADVRGRGTNDQHLVQVKWTDGLTVNNINVYNGAALSMTDVSDFSINGVVGRQCTDFGGLGAVYIFSQNDDKNNLCRRGYIGSVDIEMAANMARCMTLVAHDTTFRGRFIQNRSVDYSGNEIHIAGCDNDIDVDVKQVGSGAARGVYVRDLSWNSVANGGTGTKRNKVKLRGKFYSTAFSLSDNTVEDTTVTFDPVDITLPGTNPFFLSHAALRTRVNRANRELALTGTGGTLAFPSPCSASHYSRIIATIADASAYTIPALSSSVSGETPAGMEVEFVIVNGTAGALGTISWNAIYDLNAALTAPAAGKRASVRFRWSGTKWEQV